MINFGMSSESFRANYFEARPALLEEFVAAKDLALFDINCLIGAPDHSDGRVNLFVDRCPVPYDLYSESYQDVSEVRRRIDVQKVEGALRTGATLALNRVDRHSMWVRQVCDAIQAFTGEVATSNCYAALFGSGAFGAHWDTHDVIAVQLAGKKRWKLWPPTFEYPLHGQSSNRETFRQPDQAVLEVTLDVGNALYVPRGWWHEASCIDGFATTHLAIGLHVSTIADYFSWVISNCLIRKGEVRRSFSHVLADARLIADSSHNVQAELVNEANIKAYLDHHERLVAIPARRVSDASLFDRKGCKSCES